MKRITPEQRVKDLAKFERAGIPTQTLEELLDVISKRGSEKMTSKTKDKLRDNRDKAQSLSRRIEKLGRKARAFVEADPFLGVQTPVYNLPSNSVVGDDKFPILPSSEVGKAFEGMEFLAKSFHESSVAFGKYLRAKGRFERGVQFFLEWILWCNEDFHYWKELSRLLAKAFPSHGIQEVTRESLHFTPEMLRKTAKLEIRRRAAFERT